MKFRTRSVIKEAMQFDGTVESANIILGWCLTAVNYRHARDDEGSIYLLIPTLEGTMVVNPGDWIIKGVKGEFYPCKPDIFEATYELVTEEYKCLTES